MAEPFAIHVDDSAVRQLLSQLPTRLAADVAAGAVSAVTAETEGHIREALSGGVLKTRSGTYKRSITSRIERQGDVSRGTVGTVFPGANLQERGGTVSPKGKKWLTIPVGAALNDSGVRRFDAPTALKNGAFFPTKQGKVFVPMIARRSGPGIRAARQGGYSFVSLFALKQSVTIPARPVWGPAMEWAKTRLIETVTRLVAEVLGRP